MLEPPVRMEGFRELRRDLRKLEPDIDYELKKELRVAAGKVATAAQAGAPRRTGEYARSIKPSVTARGVSIGSRLPQAGVLHWGGTIRPRGVPITFPPHPVITDALDRQVDSIMKDIGDAVDRALRDFASAQTRPKTGVHIGTGGATIH